MGFTGYTEPQAIHYHIVLRGDGVSAPEVRVANDGKVEFVNFTPDAASKQLFEILGKTLVERASKSGGV